MSPLHSKTTRESNPKPKAQRPFIGLLLDNLCVPSSGSWAFTMNRRSARASAIFCSGSSFFARRSNFEVRLIPPGRRGGASATTFRLLLVHALARGPRVLPSHSRRWLLAAPATRVGVARDASGLALPPGPYRESARPRRRTRRLLRACAQP